MSEERKGQPIEKWDAEIGVPVIDAFAMTDPTRDENGRAIGARFVEERVKDPNALGNQMLGIEDMIEQNDNSFDGIINNLPEPEDRNEKEERAKESVLKKLKESVKISADDREKPPRSFCPDRELC